LDDVDVVPASIAIDDRFDQECDKIT